MNSTTTANARNPDEVLVARADERLAHAYEQIAQADDQLARVTEQLSRLEHGAPRPASALQPSDGRPALRGLIGVALAAGIGAAAFVIQSSPYAQPAKLTIAQWVPQFATSSLQLAKPVVAATSSPPTVQLASVEATAAQPAPSAPMPAPSAATTAAPMSPELTQLLQSMAHDIATLEQGIEQLKASQERMAADNAKAVGELKASQEQMTHLAARSPAPAAQAKTAAPPPPKPAAAAAPKPVVTAARKPPPPPKPPSKPIQLQPDDQ